MGTKVCTWVRSGNAWETRCGETVAFHPLPSARFCCYCGDEMALREQATLFPVATSEDRPDQVDAVVKIWNTERKPGPRVQRMTPQRRAGILKALKLVPDLNVWRDVVRFINGQRWCNAAGTGEHPNWRMDFDHLLKPGKLLAAIERMKCEPTAGSRDARRGTTGTKTGKYAALG